MTSVAGGKAAGHSHASIDATPPVGWAPEAELDLQDIWDYCLHLPDSGEPCYLDRPTFDLDSHELLAARCQFPFAGEMRTASVYVLPNVLHCSVSHGHTVGLTWQRAESREEKH
jgi:hypothetical protein